MSQVCIDPLHGTLKLEDWERKLLDVPEIQRLRYIRQTGLAFLAYPSAVHTIFDHIVGTMCLAKKYVHFFNINEHEKKLLSASIILAEIGNEPLRHALWDVENRIPEVKISRTEKSIAIIRSSKEIAKIVRNAELKFDEIHDTILEAPIRKGEKWHHKLQPLVTGPLSFNRLDYYLRDAHYAGIKVVGFDPGEILLGSSFHAEKGLIYDEKAIPSIENFLISRINLYFYLYSHPTAIIAQKMLARAIERFVGNEFEKFRALRKQVLEEFLSDDEFIYKLREILRCDKVSQRIVQLIEVRQLYRSCNGIYRWTELREQTRLALETYLEKPVKWRDCEEKVNSELGAQFGEIVVDFDKPTIESLVKNIFVSKNGETKRIDEVSPLIGPLDEKPDMKTSKRRKYGLMEMERRNWFFGIYYDSDRMEDLGVTSEKIRNKIEEVFDIDLPR